VPPDEVDKLLTEHFSAPAGQPNSACLRIRTDQIGSVSFYDEIHGICTTRLDQECGDFVVLRRDGLWAYQFVCAVDDALMGITRVVRGKDLLSSTARQVAIITALGHQTPEYRHVPLLLEEGGRRMSKRDGSQSLKALRDNGYSPEEARELIGKIATANQGSSFKG
jgi:glutamyl-tRNA synthetase